MSLETGKRLHRMKGTVLPMPTDVISRVAALARRRLSDPFDLVFLDRDHNPIIGPSPDTTLVELEDDVSVASDNSGSSLVSIDYNMHADDSVPSNGPDVVPDSTSEVSNHTDGDNNNEDPEEVSNPARVDGIGPNDDPYGSALESAEGDLNRSTGVDPPDSDSDSVQNTGVFDAAVTFDNTDENAGVDGTLVDTLVDSTENTRVDFIRPRTLQQLQPHNNPGVGDTPVPIAPGRCNLCPRGLTSTLEGRDVSADHTDIVKSINLFVNLFVSAQTEPITQLIVTVLTQYNMKQGIRLFGDKAMEAIKKEMLQLYTREVLLPRKKVDLGAIEESP